MITDKLFRIYKSTISPLIKQSLLFPENGCRFYPTCSEYTSLAIKKHGILKGTLKGLWRILRCNPYSKGGIEYP